MYDILKGEIKHYSYVITTAKSLQSRNIANLILIQCLTSYGSSHDINSGAVMVLIVW